MNMGRSAYLARHGVDGIVDISPFTCMNGVVSEAIYPKLSRDFRGDPHPKFLFRWPTIGTRPRLGNVPRYGEVVPRQETLSTLVPIAVFGARVTGRVSEFFVFDAGSTLQTRPPGRPKCPCSGLGKGTTDGELADGRAGRVIHQNRDLCLDCHEIVMVARSQ